MQKPTGLYRAGAETAQRIADLLSGLRRIRENVPHEAIEQVLEHRQHSVGPRHRHSFKLTDLDG